MQKPYTYYLPLAVLGRCVDTPLWRERTLDAGQRAIVRGLMERLSAAEQAYERAMDAWMRHQNLEDAVRKQLQRFDVPSALVAKVEQPLEDRYFELERRHERIRVMVEKLRFQLGLKPWDR